MTDDVREVLADPDALAGWADDVAGSVGGEKCYNPTRPTTIDPADDPFPWDHDRANSRAPDKTQLVLTTVLTGDTPLEPVPRAVVQREVFGAPDAADRNLVTRLTQNHGEILQNRKPAGEPARLKPTRRAVSLTRALIRSMHATKPPGEALPWVEVNLPPRGETGLLPAERYAAIFGRCETVGTDAQRALAAMLHAEHRATLLADGTDGEVGRWIAGTGGQLTRADDQRFASVARVDRERARFEAVLDVVRDRGPWVWATFTLPRECADSPLHSYAVLADGLTRFHTRCETDPVDPAKPGRPGERPAFVAVTDAQTQSGWGHRHVLYPGRAQLYDAAGLDADWTDLARQDWADLVGAPPGVEPQVSVETVRSPDRFEEVWDYMRQPFARWRSLAGMSVADLRALADRLRGDGATDRDRALAAMTTLWPGERRCGVRRRTCGRLWITRAGTVERSGQWISVSISWKH